jgi:transposase InsO family protein
MRYCPGVARPATTPCRVRLFTGQYCYPLTVTDHASRYLLLCEALESTREDLAITAFEQLFQERGLPQAIRSDHESHQRLGGVSRDPRQIGITVLYLLAGACRPLP